MRRQMIESLTGNEHPRSVHVPAANDEQKKLRVRLCKETPLKNTLKTIT